MQVTTLGQPLEVLKTQMAANRSQTMLQATKNVWNRGGVAGFYQGLIPWVTIYLFILLLCLQKTFV
jgi:Mitochondrial carrier protein